MGKFHFFFVIDVICILFCCFYLFYLWCVLLKWTDIRSIQKVAFLLPEEENERKKEAESNRSNNKNERTIGF